MLLTAFQEGRSPHIADLTVSSISDIMCACNADVIANLGKAIAGQISHFDPRSLTDALWGFAKLGGKLDGGTISKLAQRVKELASKFKPQEAANALWALVKLDQQNGGNAMKVRSQDRATCYCMTFIVENRHGLSTHTAMMLCMPVHTVRARHL